ncbi:MAG: energy-coupling factor ABC transporter permease, partial [Desulfatirhabdiaceae bacterium]
MHITEGIIIGKEAVLYTAAGISLMAWGVSRINRFVRKAPENKPLLGMGAALIFFLSLIPIPAFTGTCSHPCGTPLIGILLGPSIGIALTGISLLLQAAFFAHGGFSTWGANVIALGFFGCCFGWGVFRLVRKLGFPLWAAGFAGGLVGDIMVYASSGMILGTTLVQAPNPQYSLGGYLLVIYSAYLPTQLPIAIGEALITGMALHYANRQRPEILTSLGILPAKKVSFSTSVAILSAILFTLGPGYVALSEAANPAAETVVDDPPVHDSSSRFSGMDEAVNEALAEKAGRPARDPYLNTDDMGDLGNLLLLSAGGICGFIMGRYWHLLWGRPKGQSGISLHRDSV